MQASDDSLPTNELSAELPPSVEMIPVQSPDVVEFTTTDQVAVTDNIAVRDIPNSDIAKIWCR